MTNLKSSSSNIDNSNLDDNTEELDQLDYSKLDKEHLYKLLLELNIEENIALSSSVIKQLKIAFDNLLEAEKSEALQKYQADGGATEDFDFKKDELSVKFEKTLDNTRDKIQQIYSKSEKEKEQNLKQKQQILENLRLLIADEETSQSIIQLKDYQEQWRKLGAVPHAAHKELWQNYNALIDRFYNNRSIYFELKELDRKKNFESKIELCKKAEDLAANPSLNNALKELKTLHEEYKMIGPVPKEDSEVLWTRFKDASDKIYDKRTEYLQKQKQIQEQALVEKNLLLTQMEEFTTFKSDRIDDWKEKTIAYLKIQEDWKNSGAVPAEAAKEISKKFWALGKIFFKNKEAFFDVLEEKRRNNLKEKEALCEQVETISKQEDNANAANQIKDIQKLWDKIGAVPIKQKNAIFQRFKSACDAYFNKKRAEEAEVEKSYEKNFDDKMAVCNQILELSQSSDFDLATLKSLQDQYNLVGFVPRNKIKDIQNKYNEVIQACISKLEKVNPDNQHLKLSLEMAAMKSAPDADKKVQRKEQDLSRKIQTMKAEVEQYKTNMDFFGRSAAAEKMKKEIVEKITILEKEIKDLNAQLKIIKNS